MTYELKRCRRRNPVIWLAMIALAAVLGISSRRFAAMLPGFIAAYAGDTLLGPIGKSAPVLSRRRAPLRWDSRLPEDERVQSHYSARCEVRESSPIQHVAWPSRALTGRPGVPVR